MAEGDRDKQQPAGGSPDRLIESPHGFERLIADISTRFTRLSPGDVDREMSAVLALLGDYLGVDRCFIFSLNEDKDRHLVSNLWTRRGVEQDAVVLGTVVQEGFPWVGEQMLERRDIVIRRLDDLPAAAATERGYCEGVGIQSFLMCPMYSNEMALGTLGIDAIRNQRDWSDQDIRRLRMVGEVIGNELIRKHLNLEIQDLKDRLEAENSYLREAVELSYSHDEIVGTSKIIREMLKKIEQVAKTDSRVLIRGETGTGKGLVARAIHHLSGRSDKPLVSVNCAALSPTLIENELFGCERGAYTGALARQVGRFEIADGSTIFLDEVGELAPEVQAKLLRILEEGEFERLGSPKTHKVDVRVIAATNRDLEKAVAEGAFRQDLYFRLSVFPISVPPLRERREDIPMLVWSFIKEFEPAMGRVIERVPKPTMEALQNSDWRGNVRELRNVIERAMILGSGRVLQVDLPTGPTDPGESAPRTLAEVEEQHIRRVLEQVGWRVRGHGKAAELLGLNPSTLESRMKKLGIDRP